MPLFFAAKIVSLKVYQSEPGAVARLVAIPLRMQATLRSISVSSTFSREDLVMKIFL